MLPTNPLNRHFTRVFSCSYAVNVCTTLVAYMYMYMYMYKRRTDTTLSPCLYAEQ